MSRSLLTRTIFIAGVAILSIYAVIGVPKSTRQQLSANWHRNIPSGDRSAWRNATRSASRLAR